MALETDMASAWSACMGPAVPAHSTTLQAFQQSLVACGVVAVQVAVTTVWWVCWRVRGCGCVVCVANPSAVCVWSFVIEAVREWCFQAQQSPLENNLYVYWTNTGVWSGAGVISSLQLINTSTRPYKTVTYTIDIQRNDKTAIHRLKPCNTLNKPVYNHFWRWFQGCEDAGGEGPRMGQSLLRCSWDLVSRVKSTSSIATVLMA